MNSGILPIILSGLCTIGSLSSARSGTGTPGSSILQPDTLDENQILYNGREWKNLYVNVENDQFFLSGEFLKGSLTIQGRTFHNLSLTYDLFKDEILTPIVNEAILQLNKELVDSFSIHHQGLIYRFARLSGDSIAGLNGYARIIYGGKTDLYIKYIKKIDRPGVENKNDSFYQTSRMYLVKAKQAYMIRGKNDLFRILKDHRVLLRDFMKKNQIRLSKKVPESFLPVLRYYDSINP